MKNLIKISNIIKNFNSSLGKVVSWLTLFMVIVTFIIVILRYVFNLGFIWMQELVRFMYAGVFMLAAAYTLENDEQVRIDILYQKMPIKIKALVNLLGSLFFLIPVCLVILFFSFNYVMNSWIHLEGSLEERGLHGVFILKTFIWVFSFTLILQSISTIINSLRTLMKERE